MWRATVLTLFPELFPGPLGASVLGRAHADGHWALEAVHLRDFSDNKYGSIDDTPAGGGAGLVMRADILAAAIDSTERDARPLLCLTPRGKPFAQARAHELAKGPGLIAICGRFEGIDERLFAARGVEEVSIGDFVLAGGEIGAMALIEACVRLLPGVLGSPSSLGEESFEGGLLEYPQYTRPREFEGREIPDVLLSGGPQENRRVAAAKGGRNNADATTGPLGEVFARRSYPARRQQGTQIMNIIEQLEKEHMEELGKEVPEFAPGDTLRVSVKVKEGERERLQAFEGVCIARNGGGLNESFTVRKISFGEGVERVFPIYSPLVDSIKVVRRGKVRRAKLYYLRERRGKSARIAEKVDRRTAKKD